MFTKYKQLFRMAGQYSIHAFEQRAALAKEKLCTLQQYLEKLEQNRSYKEEKRLKLENERLVTKVATLKKQLADAELENGTQQQSILSSKHENTNQQVMSESKSPPSSNVVESKIKASKPKEPKKNTTKQPKKAQDDVPVDVSRLDLRVAQIVDVKRHPDADTLYVEQIQTGEDTLRTVVTGLVKHVPIEQMENRMVMLMCNLKPAKMRGIVSQGMVMCADNSEAAEIINPPPGSVPGDRIEVEGFPGTPDGMLNPKKKVWERIQPDLRTNEECVVCYKGVPLSVKGKGVCKVPTLSNCRIK